MFKPHLTKNIFQSSSSSFIRHVVGFIFCQTLWFNLFYEIPHDCMNKTCCFAHVPPDQIGRSRNSRVATRTASPSCSETRIFPSSSAPSWASQRLPLDQTMQFFRSWLSCDGSRLCQKSPLTAPLIVSCVDAKILRRGSRCPCTIRLSRAILACC